MSPTPGIVDAFGRQPNVSGNPPQMQGQEDELSRVYGPLAAQRLRYLGNALSLGNPLQSPTPQTGPLFNAFMDKIGSLFGGAQPEATPQFLGTGGITNIPKPTPQMPGGDIIPTGGGMDSAFTGVPLPQAPQLVPPNVDIAAMFDPIIAGLKDPERIKGPSKIEGLAQVLGGAARGAQEGLGAGFRAGRGAGAVIAGAGAGATSALASLRHEEQQLEAQHQEAVQRMTMARANVQGQKAGATIDLARDVANTANAEAQLRFNRDVQASIQSHQQVHALGDGRVLIQSFDPNTGQGTMKIVDTADPVERALKLAYIDSQIQKNLRPPTGKNSPKIVIDGKQYERSALMASASTQVQTPLEAESFELALRALQNPSLRQKYSKVVEDEIMSHATSDVQQMWAKEPERVILQYLYHTFITNPAERTAMWSYVGAIPSGGQATPPAPTAQSEPDMSKMSGQKASIPGSLSGMRGF